MRCFNPVHSDVVLCVCLCGSVVGLLKLKGAGMNMLRFFVFFKFLTPLPPKPHSTPSNSLLPFWLKMQLDFFSGISLAILYLDLVKHSYCLTGRL